MSQELWDSFPPDIQQAIENVSGYVAADRYGKNFDDQGKGGLEKMQKAGVKVSDISDEELKRWANVIGKPIWDEWVAEMESKGLPGQAVLDETLRLAEKYK